MVNRNVSRSPIAGGVKLLYPTPHRSFLSFLSYNRESAVTEKVKHISVDESQRDGPVIGGESQKVIALL